MRKRIKKYQKQVTKFINSVNKNIENDWLWGGRFYVKQVNYRYYDFPDGSGGCFQVLFEVRDRKTKKVELYAEDYLGSLDRIFKSHVNYCVNDFITKYVKVWEENPNPYEQARMEGRSPSGTR